MADRNDRPDQIGRTVQQGRADRIVAASVGHGPADQDRRMVIERRRLSGADFSGRELDDFRAISSTFVSCDFRSMRIRDACWGEGPHRSSYRGCRFDGSHFRSRVPGNARFLDCTFEEVVIHEFLAHDIELIGCTFSGRLENGFLNGSRIRKDLRFLDRRRNKIVGNDFRRCELKDFAFRSGIDLDRQVLPQGPRYLHLRDPEQAIRTIQFDLPHWTDAEMRRLGHVVLDVWRFEAGRGQTQIFVCIPTDGVFAPVYQRLLPIVAGVTAG